MAKRRGNPQNLTPWKKGETGNPNGRPRKVLTKLENQIGIKFNVSLSKEDKYQIVESMLEMSLTELKQVAQDQDAPVFMVTIAKGIADDIKKGRINTVESMFDRFFGRAKQAVDVTSNGETLVPAVIRNDIK